MRIPNLFVNTRNYLITYVLALNDFRLELKRQCSSFSDVSLSSNVIVFCLFMQIVNGFFADINCRN